jgi:hypothetical protein
MKQMLIGEWENVKHAQIHHVFVSIEVHWGLN